MARVDAIAAYLGQAQAREFEKWPRLGTYVWPNPPIYANPTTYAGIISAKKSWIAGRFNWIDSQYPVPPGIQVPADPYYITPGYLLTLVGAAPTKLLTLDGSDPRLAGGAISPAARTYSGPVTLEGSAQVVARGRSGVVWGGPARATLLSTVSPLRITELMYRPAPPPAGSPHAPSDFEFIELGNTGVDALESGRLRSHGRCSVPLRHRRGGGVGSPARAWWWREMPGRY